MGRGDEEPRYQRDRTTEVPAYGDVIVAEAD